MKISRATSGPYRNRVHYTSEELEALTEDELRAQNLLPATPAAINIDLYVEQRFVTPRYEDLRPNLLGYTEFSTNGPIDIVLNQTLASDPSIVSKRRVRTTIAHEAGHALLHAILYLDAEQTSFIRSEAEPAQIMCKDADLARTRYDGKWWEYQANLAMGMLLLPKGLTLTALEPFLTRTPLGGRNMDPHNLARAGRALSAIFDVNPQAARLRIQRLFPTE